MRTLQAFWAYFDGEKPDAAKALLLAQDELSWGAASAMEWAACIISERTDVDHYTEHEQEEFALEEHHAAFRDLSLTLCEALTKMREQVPVPTWSDKRDGMAGYVQGIDHETGIMTITTEPNDAKPRADIQQLLNEHWEKLRDSGRERAERAMLGPLLEHHNRLLAEIDKAERNFPKAVLLADGDAQANVHRCSSQNPGYAWYASRLELRIFLDGMSAFGADKLRGLKPVLVTMMGEMQKCAMRDYLFEDVLAPMFVVPGVTWFCEHSAMADALREALPKQP